MYIFTDFIWVEAELEDRPRSHHHVHLQHVILEQHVLFVVAVNKGTEQRRRRRAQIIVIAKQSPARQGIWSEETMSQIRRACIQQVDIELAMYMSKVKQA